MEYFPAKHGVLEVMSGLVDCGSMSTWLNGYIVTKWGYMVGILYMVVNFLWAMK